jgi:nicotinamidase-related amidase
MVGMLCVLLLLLVALAGVRAVPTAPRRACFGGAGHSATEHVATYGHVAGAATCAQLATNSDSPPPPPPAPDQQPELVLHTRGKGGATATQRWQGAETAMVVIDMWSYHPCKTVTNRAGSLVPRLNAVAAAVRAAGGLVLFAPTDAAEVYSGWPQRERVFKTPHATPVFQNISVPPLASVTTGSADECSDAGHGCVWNYGEARQNPAIVIEPSDYIVGGDTNPIDVYSVLTHHGIKNVLHAGIAENICVQAKCEGIPTLTQLGFNCALMRDLTDAQSHYEPESYRGNASLPWVHMDWGTRNVTKSIEDQGIAVTVEGASLAVAAGVWPKHSNPDPVVHTPWGTVKRPQIFDTSQTVTLSTCCDMEATVGCSEPYEIRYTLDGSDPSQAGALLYTHPFVVTTNVTIRAIGLDPAGAIRTGEAAGADGSTPSPRFAESQSVLVRRPLSPALTAAALQGQGQGLVPALLESVQLELTRTYNGGLLLLPTPSSYRSYRTWHASRPCHLCMRTTADNALYRTLALRPTFLPSLQLHHASCVIQALPSYGTSAMIKVTGRRQRSTPLGSANR